MKRILAVGCSHGSRANKQACEAVIRFKKTFKPHTVIHLGDAFDTAAFRAGARYGNGDSDERDDIQSDFSSARAFLKELDPSAFTEGNHEERLWHLANHSSSIIALAAQTCLEDLASCLPRSCRRTRWNIETNWVQYGDFRFGHGFFFNENFLRDSAECFGNCVVAHAHKAGEIGGRTLKPSRALSPGTLADIPAMAYAGARRATLAWSHGFVWGEYDDASCHLTVHQWPRGETKWHLPG